MNKRIRHLRKEELGLSQTEFGEGLGVGQSTVSALEKDGTTVTEQMILLICSIYKCSEQWLRDGSGPVFPENDKKKAEFFAIFDKLSPVFQDYLISNARELLETQSRLEAYYSGVLETAHQDEAGSSDSDDGQASFHFQKGL